MVCRPFQLYPVPFAIKLHTLTSACMQVVQNFLNETYMRQTRLTHAVEGEGPVPVLG